MRRLMAITYEDEIRGGRAAEEIGRCAESLLIDPDATSVAICERDGSLRLTTSRRPDATAPWSKFWGTLLGAVMHGGEAAEPLADDFPARLRLALVPGSSVLLLAVPASREPAVLDALSPLDGEEIACTLPADLPRRWDIEGLSFVG
jgi:uncharacterized membrane protein